MSHQPNDCGVYCVEPPAEGLTVFKTALKRSHIELEILEVEPAKFATGYSLEYGCGNHHGHGCGIGGPFYSSFDSALNALLERARKHFHPDNLHPHDSCVSDEQRTHAAHFTALLESGWPHYGSALFELEPVAAIAEPEPDYDRCEECGELFESCECSDTICNDCGEEECICVDDEPELEPEPEVEVEPVNVEPFTSTEQLSLF